MQTLVLNAYILSWYTEHVFTFKKKSNFWAQFSKDPESYTTEMKL